MKKEATPYLSLAFLTGLNLFNYLDRLVLPAVLGPLKGDLHITDAQASSTNNAFMLGYFLTSPLFGYLGDRFARKWLIAVGIFFWSLGTSMTAFSAGLVSLLAYRLLVGLGEASYATLAPAWISDLFSAKRRNNALTIFYVAIPVGSAMGFLAGGFALKHGGWRQAFLWAGAPGLLLAILLLFLREPARGEADREEGVPAPPGSEQKPSLADMLKLFKIWDFNLVVLGYTAYTFVLGGFSFWASTFLSRVHGLQPDASALFFGGSAVVAGLVGTLLGGFAATAWQRRYNAGYAMMLLLPTLAAVPVTAVAFQTSSVLLSEICLGVAMLLLFLSTGPINTIIVESVPVTMRAGAMALSIFAIHLLGDFWSPLLVGFLSDHWNDPHNAAVGLQKAVLIMPVMLAVAAAWWGWLVWRKHREHGAAVV